MAEFRTEPRTPEELWRTLREIADCFVGLEAAIAAVGGTAGGTASVIHPFVFVLFAGPDTAV